MSDDRNRVITDMAAAIAREAPFSECHSTEVEAALRAAAERGYRLAKLPDKLADDAQHRVGWNGCLDAIETIELEGGDD